jgi:hypothetical protein
LLQPLLWRPLELTDTVLPWIEDLADGPWPDTLRSRALLVLAFHDRRTTDDILKIVDHVAFCALPDLTAAAAVAAARAGTGTAVRRNLPTDPVLRCIANAYLTQ